MHRTLALTASAVLVSVFTAAAAAPAADPDRNPELIALLDEHVDWLMRDNPTWASRRGDERFNDRLRDESPRAYEQRRRTVEGRLERLLRLDGAGFSDRDRLDADLLRYELERSLQRASFYPQQTPIDNRSGPQISLPQLHDSLAFTRQRHYADYATRLEAMPRLIEQHIEQMRAGLEAGRVPPRVVVGAAPGQARALATPDVIDDPRRSPFYAPFNALPDDDPAAVRARRAIRDGIAPAMAELTRFLEEEYLPECRDTIGASDSSDGRAFYDAMLAQFTTTDLTAQQIHDIGLEEVARIRAEMLETIARTDYPNRDSLEGDRLLAAFFEYLRTDPRFYYDDPEDLLRGYRDISKRADAELPRLFRTLPRLPYGVRELPLLAARTAPTAYYYPGSLEAGIPGYFVANTYRLDQRPKYEMIALTLHEAVPGHHLQIALAQELEDVHEFRTLVRYTAFSEGWALYAERLGLEMIGDGRPGGLYADPYADFGRLTYEMWRACRLVVDTGIHALGWPRQRAIDFMLENTALSPLNVEREIDRYISWPGQACAYKIGELKIRRLRARAEQTLGDEFDIRAFHDALLTAGALPLPVLEARIDRWIEAQRQ